MSDTNAEAETTDPGLQSRFPTAYTILFILIILVAALTWIIPAGQYDRVTNEDIGREVAVPGTYQTVDANPQGPIDVLMAPIAGFYDPDSYAANAIDVALFVLLLGGFLGVVNATGAINTGIRSAMGAMKGRPPYRKVLQAQGNALQEAQAFTETWFARRHTATKSALEAAQGITKNGGSDPTELAKGMTDWLNIFNTV